MSLSFRCLILLFYIYTLTLDAMQAYGEKKTLEKWRALQIHPYNLDDVLRTFQLF